MTKISENKYVFESEHNMATLSYVKKELQNNSSENSNNIQHLTIELCDLIERILKNQNEMQQQLEDNGFDKNQSNNDVDNFNLDKESVKKIILKEISVGQIFYPSDIANEYSLDLRMVMTIMDELKESKQIIENM